MFSTCKFRIIVIERLDVLEMFGMSAFIFNIYEEELIKLMFSFSHSRAEGLATEIKELQGQLADYNTVITQNWYNVHLAVKIDNAN